MNNEKKQNTIQKRQKPQKKTFIESLKKMPNIQAACNKTEITRSTYYRWVDSDKTFESEAGLAMHEGRDLITDVAEGKLIGFIGAGSWPAARYWLEHHSKIYKHYDRRKFEQKNGEDEDGIRLHMDF